MKLEEIVALSVKHNVSDLHLCNSRRTALAAAGAGWSPRPFPRRILRNLLNDWLDAAQLAAVAVHDGQVDFALALAAAAAAARQRLRPRARDIAGAASPCLQRVPAV